MPNKYSFLLIGLSISKSVVKVQACASVHNHSIINKAELINVVRHVLKVGKLTRVRLKMNNVQSQPQKNADF